MKILRRLWDFLMSLFQESSPKETNEMEYVPLTKESIEEIKKILEPTMQEKFLNICLGFLDERVSPKNEVPDNVSCAWDVSILISKLPGFENFKKQASTKLLDGQLFLDKRFSRIVNPAVTTPRPGSIWMYPAKTDSKGNIITHGHVLVQITSERLASNNSEGVNKGKFTGNYTIEEARKEFITKRGLKEYIYEFKD